MQLFVHKYKWSHEKRRKELKSLLKNREVKIVEKKKEGWLYEVPTDIYSELKKKI